MFGKRLKELRLERQLTQEELAKELNVSPSTISLYESGNREPSSVFIVAVARYFHVSSDYLLGLQESDSHLTNTNMESFVRQFLDLYFKNYGKITPFIPQKNDDSDD